MLHDEIEIIDLPKGYPDFIYVPLRYTYVSVRRKGAMQFQPFRASQAIPLVLNVGDTVRFFANFVPQEFVELATASSAHPAYAVITRKGTSGKTKDPDAVFVGTGTRP